MNDVESIRKALGGDKLDYYGASYGTYLGSAYATVYPKNVDKMVLDGNVGPSGVWYEANLNQDVAFDKNIEYYFGWIAKYDSVYHLGATQKKVRSFFYDLRGKLKKKPVYYTDPDSGQQLAVGPDELTDVILNAAYRRSQAVWHGYAAASPPTRPATPPPSSGRSAPRRPARPTTTATRCTPRPSAPTPSGRRAGASGGGTTRGSTASTRS